MEQDFKQERCTIDLKIKKNKCFDLKMARLFGNIDRSKMIPVRDFLTARKSASSWPYIDWSFVEKWSEKSFHRGSTANLSRISSLLIFRRDRSLHQETARLRDERPCVRSLVSARDATRFCPRIEFCGCYCLTVAVCAHVYRDLGCLQ